MLRTKKAKKALTKKLQKHLTEVGIHTIKDFEESRIKQKQIMKNLNTSREICWTCWEIEKRLKGDWS